MSPALKNRLVGTIVLVAVIVIFLPDLLDGKKQTNSPNFVQFPRVEDIPKAQEIEAIPEQEIKQNVESKLTITDDVALDEQADGEAIDRDAESLIAQTVITEPLEPNTLDAGWVVQLGSFRHQKNVNELLDKLETAGYRAFSRKVDTSAGRLTKVFVGPDVDKLKLERALPHLTETTGLKGKVAPFDIAQ